MIPGFLYALKPLDLPITAVLSTVWRYAFAAIVAAITCARALRDMPMPPQLATNGLGQAITRIVLYNLLFGVLYLLIIVALYRSMEPLRQFAKLVPDLVPQASSWGSGARGKVERSASATCGEPAISEIRLENTP
jgi:hypothetical protein